jgi:hypothetical protein
LLWAIPFLGFLFFIQFVSEFHLIPLLPLLCICAARLIVGLSDTITVSKIAKILPYFIISTISIFGLINVVTQLTSHSNDDRIETASFVTRYLNDNNGSNITMIANHLYSWIPKYVFGFGKDYRIPEIDPIEMGPKINRSLFVVDGTFKSIMSGDDEVGKRLRGVYYAHTNNRSVVTVEAGPNKVVLPEQSSFYNDSAKLAGVNLLSNQNKWNMTGNGQLSHVNGTLTLLVETKGTDKVTRNAVLKTQLDNITETPLLLSLSYSSKSTDGNDTFFLEIKDAGNQKRYFKSPLKNTSGNETTQLFIIPSEIVSKPTEFRFGLNINTPGEHILVLKTITIINQV